MSTDAVAPPTSRTVTRRAVLASGIGNFVEQYDFGVYGYLAPILAPLFFPDSTPLVGLLATYGIYAVSSPRPARSCRSRSTRASPR